MPRRQSIPRMTKYHTEPANRTTARFTAKLMANGKRNLSDRILRQVAGALDAAHERADQPNQERDKNGDPAYERRGLCVVLALIVRVIHDPQALADRFRVDADEQGRGDCETSEEDSEHGPIFPRSARPIAIPAMQTPESRSDVRMWSRATES